MNARSLPELMTMAAELGLHLPVTRHWAAQRGLGRGPIEWPVSLANLWQRRSRCQASTLA